ncbi:MAG: hypothetical protein IJS14_14325 [Lentisphaeria bacterium]|nr:hypothetical protein [Lentisphaeria bacterium]
MIYENAFLKVDFSADAGGLPAEIRMKLAGGEEYAVLPSKEKYPLEIRLGNGKTLHPVIPPGYREEHYRLEDHERVQFDRIPFADQEGNPFASMFLTTRYEFWDDGTVFANSYFVCEKYLPDFTIRSYAFNFTLDLSGFEETAVPVGVPADFGRFCSGAADGSWKQDGIRTNFNFSCRRKDGPDAYVEIFMEDAPSLERKHEHRTTSLTWQDRRAAVTWDFQSEEAAPSRDFEWAQLNSWGFLFRSAPQQRRNPPLRMYHLIDNYEGRMPSLRTLRLMAEAGADAVVLHEAWRSDPVNFAVPWDPKALRDFIEEAHRLAIRVVLYIRGHRELTTEEDCCDWFGMYLKADWDGLYADFGGAHNGLIDGKIRYRLHYLKIRRIRKVLGKYGLFYAHCGMLSSGIGLTPELIDGYVSGEGERGALGSGRFIHEHISGSCLTNGTFWTAAFPHYGDGRMVPFMASAGQYPHAPLGTQWKSSSLSHPGVPGINDLYLRGLWKLWGTFKFMRDLTYYTDYNSIGVLDDPDRGNTGAYLQLAPEKKCALLILSNFSNRPRRCSVTVRWEKTVFRGLEKNCKVYRLTPDSRSPGKAMPYDSVTDFSLDLPGHAVGGFLLGEESFLAEAVRDFERPYPAASEEQEAYLREVAVQRKYREMPDRPEEELYMKMVMPEAHVPFICVKDFHSLEHRVGTMDGNGKFVQLGYITKRGFTKEKPAPEDWVWAEEESPWISLRELFPEGGRHNVVIRSYGVTICEGEYFHSLHTLILSPAKDRNSAGARTLVFCNEVEPERENFHFPVWLTERNPAK